MSKFNLKELLIENKKLRECVEFYANERSWNQSYEGIITVGKGEYAIDSSDLSYIKKYDFHAEKIQVGGKQARKCLEEIK